MLLENDLIVNDFALGVKETASQLANAFSKFSIKTIDYPAKYLPVQSQ